MWLWLHCVEGANGERKGEAHEMMYNMRNDGKGWKCDEGDARFDH